MTNTAVFPQTAKTAVAVCAVGKTTYGDTANAVLLLTAGTNGCEVTGLTALPRATVTATQLQLYASLDGGATLVLVDTALMAAYTMSQTTAVAPTDFGPSDATPLRLAANARLYVGIGVALAAGVAFFAQYRDF